MSYSVSVEEGRLCLTLSGEVDLQITSELKEVLTGLLRSAPQPSSVEVYAGEVSYIDSSGIALMLYAKKECSEHHITFRLKEISQVVMRILQLAKLEHLLKAEHVTTAQEPVKPLG